MVKFNLLIHVMDFIEFSLSKDEFMVDILEMLSKEWVYKNRYDTLIEYDDSDFKHRFR